ncbi:MAG: phosphoglycerate kinase [Candidatus Cloacimonetes bacterium]|nr:phosphoglycerate kinase [Candidatus Cloacimonadota bacterium]
MVEINNLPKIQEAYLKGKIVLLRVDHNVVKKGKISDTYRIEATIPTILHILKKGGKPVIMTHIGRPKDKQTGNINISPNDDVEPIVEYLIRKYRLCFAVPECQKCGDKGYFGLDSSINFLLKELREGKFDGIYLPNTRFFAGEEDKGELKKTFGKQLAGIADLFVNDAFGSWQPHASTIEPVEYLPSYAGLLMQKEIKHLTDIFYAKKPLTAVVAGSKFDTKIKPLQELLKVADNLILGGVIYNAYIAAKYGITIKGISEENMIIARDFVKMAEQYPKKVIEPEYIVESDTLEGKFEGQYRTHKISDLKPGTQLNYILDIGKESFENETLKETIMKSKTFFVNAVMGLTPHFTEGTIGMYSLINQNKEAMKLFGGGDTLEEFKKLLPELYWKCIDDLKYYFFTGGGTILTAIEQGSPWKLDTIKALVEVGNKNREFRM